MKPLTMAAQDYLSRGDADQQPYEKLRLHDEWQLMSTLCGFWWCGWKLSDGVVLCV